MAVIKKKRTKSKKVKKPVIEYPPVPTKKWIPPDERPKKPKPTGYQKPEGVTQKLKISSLKKIWHQFEFVDKTAAILLGHYSQTHKKYNFVTNGYQGSCNCAIACIFATLYQMTQWDRYYLDRILDLGDELYIKTITQSGSYQCEPEVPPDGVFNSIFIAKRKITILIDTKSKITVKITEISDDKVREYFREALTKLFKMAPTGIIAIAGKCLALWIQDEAYYLFDPTDHDELGEPIRCSIGCGYSLVQRCKTLNDLVEILHKNVGTINLNMKFDLFTFLIQRIIEINTQPPERLEDVMQPTVEIKIEPEPVATPETKECAKDAIMEQRLKCSLLKETDPKKRYLEETSPLAEMVAEDKRPEWGRNSFKKMDSCILAIPVKVYPSQVSYYIELEKDQVGILRGATCQTDIKFSKYSGRQSMANALSALIMLRLHKSKTWVPMIVNTILKHGDFMYREAMLSIPRTQSLKLSNFQRKTEYEGRNFLPSVEDCTAIGRLQSQEYEILDLFPALETFLTDNECCIIIGPITLAVWVEDGRFYMFDPNERDKDGKSVTKQTYFGDNFVPLDYAPGVACVMWFSELKNLVATYMENVEKSRRDETFYLCKVEILDYVELPEDWYNFKGIQPGKWILRGTKSQSDKHYSDKSRNYQGPANCLVALAMQGLKPIKDWGTETIDQVLDIGDTLYCDTVDKLTEKNIFISNKLTLSEVNSTFKLLDKEASCELRECLINGLVNTTTKDNVPDLRTGINDFFKDNDIGIVTTRNISVAIWKKEEVYFYFDSHDRDDKGFTIGYGTACILRNLQLDDLIASLEANLAPAEEDWFNISRVDVKFFESGSDNQFVVPTLNNYTTIGNGSAILRSLYSEKSNKFDLNSGKQTLPMCMTALAFNKLKPSVEWSKLDLDEVLNKGDVLYAETMNEINSKDDRQDNPVEATPEATAEVKTEEPKTDSQPSDVEPNTAEEDNKDDDNKEKILTTEDVKKEFCLGLNQFNFEFEEAANGSIVDDLKDKLKELLTKDKDNDDGSVQELILESKPLTIAIWKDDKAFYVFDSKPRDKQGYVIGMEDWSEPEESLKDIEEDLEEYLGEIDEYEEEEEEGSVGSEELMGLGEDEEGEGNENVEGGAGDAGKDVDKDQGAFVEGQLASAGPGPEPDADEAEGLEEEILHYFKLVHKSSSFWGEQEKNGKACVRWFVKLSDLIDYIYGNIPPKLAKDEMFSLKLTKITNKIQIKEKMRSPEDMIDVYSGQWYSFDEIEHGFWILRGTKTIFDELFPEKNRGKQAIPCCCISLIITNVFGVMSFNESTVDSILTYGDKLYTFVKRSRKKQLMQNIDKKLNEDEVEWLIEHEGFELGDIPKRICVFKFLTEMTVEAQTIVGDINSINFDLKAGLEKFFENNTFGILQCKDLTVAIWKGEKTFYMFDGLKRGSSGLSTPIGVACITRYLSLDKMATIFKANLPKLGINTFHIHKLEMTKNLCPRQREPKPITEAKPPKISSAGFKPVIPGKTIVRGTISQDDAKFGINPGTFSAPVAIVALTMSLVHKASTWSRPIIDNIIEVGAQLYEDSLDSLGYDFDPWSEKMSIYKVQNDFSIGVLKANCEFRNMDQKGIIDAKDENVLNLRQGIERFFEENTHGIIVTEPLTLAIWEEQQEGEDEPIIYLFDPNPRGPLGMPVFTGTACAVTFVNAKLAADHIVGCILEPGLRMGEFTIVPVEIIVGNMKTMKKIKKTPTKSSINVLPRCSKLVADEQKKTLRKIAENERKRKEAKQRELLGRKGYYTLGSGEAAILRGYRSQNSNIYCEETRNNQDIANCIVAIVMHHIFSVENWNSKHIDLTLDTGDQLYIDSYIAYGPQNKKLGLENIMRKFLMKNLEIHITIYKPIISDVFNVSTLNRILNVYFQQEQFCLLSYDDQWYSIIFKSGLFYLFDPHERNIEGRPLREINNDAKEKDDDGTSGTAVVLRFDDLNNLALRLTDNFALSNDEEIGDFTLWLLNVQIKA